MGYPSADEELDVLRSTTGGKPAEIEPVLDVAQALALQRMVRDVAAAEEALRYATDLVRAKRPADSAVALVKQYVRWGAGPRAGQALILGAKAHALLNGRLTIAPQDIQRVAHPVLRHRVLLNFAADADGVTVEQVIDALLEQIKAPASGI